MTLSYRGHCKKSVTSRMRSSKTRVQIFEGCEKLGSGDVERVPNHGMTVKLP